MEKRNSGKIYKSLRIELDVWRRLKVAAAERDLSLADAVRAAVRMWMGTPMPTPSKDVAPVPAPPFIPHSVTASGERETRIIREDHATRTLVYDTADSQVRRK